MAYSFITIPSMHDIFIRMKLYLLCGQTALANRAVGQSDAFFKAAISLLAEVPRQVCVFGSYIFVRFFNFEVVSECFCNDNNNKLVIYISRVFIDTSG